ncbi:MAG TPA: hypothetical protein VGH37_02090 [Candidatus Acidoferrum sp.]|jgi:hypothetical protein
MIPDGRRFLRFALLLLACGSVVAATPSGGVFTYRRIFKSSVPEFIEIKIPQNGEQSTVEIRQLEDEPGASPFELGATLRSKVFELIGQLGYFKGLDLDVHRKIANLGAKTFEWNNGPEVYTVTFNYTLNSAAIQLLQICEGLAREQELLELLQRRAKYDRLGVNDALMQFENDLNKGILPEPARALPLLDQIAADSRFVEIARQRARSLAERIRHP